MLTAVFAVMKALNPPPAQDQPLPSFPPQEMKEAKGKSKRHVKGESDRSKEEVCRKLLMRITGKEWPKKRPKFLKNPDTGRALELDCYCEELKTAVEYQSRLHYQQHDKYHQSPEDFEKTKKRDQLKRDLCKQHGIRLIEVPWTIPAEDLEVWLRKEMGVT